MHTLFALMDCNNFYASCERVFNPALAQKPIVILSNNDGCIVARSNEAKRLGIPMAAPIHLYQQCIQAHRVHVFSSNYALYGDMSERVMRSLTMMVPHMEVYSIDEAFMQLPYDTPANLLAACMRIRQNILQWTGIPVSIGVGRTKTQAKLANKIAKKRVNGAYLLLDPVDLITHRAQTPVEDIWGIGPRLTRRLHGLGILNAEQLVHADPHMMRRLFGVTMARTLRELKGDACLQLEDIQPKKNIVSSKSFGHPVTHCVDIEEALACYVMRAWQKLRQQQHLATSIRVFLHTNPFDKTQQYYSNHRLYTLAKPSDHPTEIIQIAKTILRSLYRPGYRYKKVGVALLDLIPKHQPQQQYLWPTADTIKFDEKAVDVFEKINHQMGEGSVFFAGQGIQRTWRMASAHQSKRYTTRWQELATVVAS